MEFVRSIWENDRDYMALVEDLLEDENLLKLDDIIHHRYTTRLIHSIYVSYVSYKIAKKLNLNCRAVARAGILHDFFHEGREEIAALKQGSHNFVHPRIAVKNAETLTELSELEKDIILKHMFLTTTGVGIPKYKESMIVTCVDKYCAISEVSTPVRIRVKQKVSKWGMMLRVVHA